MIRIRQIEGEQEWRRAFEIMRELRPHLTEETFRQRCREAHAADGYSLFGAFDGDQCVGVMGLRQLTDLLHGRHLYIDDLVVTEAVRSRGVGADLLRHAEQLAVDFGNFGVRVSTGVDHEAGRRFYEREGWQLRAVTYKKGF